LFVGFLQNLPQIFSSFFGGFSSLARLALSVGGHWSGDGVGFSWAPDVGAFQSAELSALQKHFLGGSA
jgi:hypothetical protein